MDDILIFADTKEELERITKLVLEKLWEHNLFLKAKKWEFCQTRIEYLGMIIEKSPWTLSNLEELGTGPSLLRWNKHDLFLDLETFTENSFPTIPN
jgi:hypothetical protein